MTKIIASVLVLLLYQVNIILANGKDMSGIQINLYNPLIYLNNDNAFYKDNVPMKHDITNDYQDLSNEINVRNPSVLDKILRQSFKPRIVNGLPTPITEFPFSAYISVDCYPSLSGACTGSIISKSLILTAGHCIAQCKEAEEKDIEVYVGNENCVQGERIPVEEWHVHEGYSTVEPPYVIRNDIAVLKLKKQLVFSESIQPVVIDRVLDSEKLGSSFAIAGWGATKEKNVQFGSEFLLYANMTMMDLNRCKETIQDLPPQTICAHGTNYKQHPFHGDSGAAMVLVDYTRNERVYKQIGIHSLIDTDTFICVLVDINEYYIWIRDQIKKYDSQRRTRTPKRPKRPKHSKQPTHSKRSTTSPTYTKRPKHSKRPVHSKRSTPPTPGI